jgi:NTE family protein
MTRLGIGLALAAGGARGAYQAGALLALAEAGVRFSAVAGTSIGTLNGAFYAQGDDKQSYGSPGHMQDLCEKWRNAQDWGLFTFDPGDVPVLHSLHQGERLAALVEGLGWLVKHGLAGIEPSRVSALLRCWLDFERLCRSRVQLSMAMLPFVNTVWDVFSGPGRQASYLCAADLQPDELHDALLAATAIPLVFPPRAVRGARYSDAGLADALPARILHRDGLRTIVSIFLDDEARQIRQDLPHTSLLQIRPSVPIDSDPGSVFDFSRATVDRLIDLGFRDTRRYLAEDAGWASALHALGALGDDVEAKARSLPDRDAFRLP